MLSGLPSSDTSIRTTATISYSDFTKVDMRVGKIVGCRDFPDARKPAYQLKIDFGEQIGLKDSSAQITVRYKKEELIGRKIIAVVNFPPKRIGGFTSEVLVLGVEDREGAIILLEPENPNDSVLGSRVY
jgi:tRNA-binding protein